MRATANWPDATRKQVNRLVHQLRKQLPHELVGVYLHGSLAMACFNPKQSDIDLLIVTSTATSPQRKQTLSRVFLELSCHPSPVEISVLNRHDLVPWRFPTPYDLHFSEMWRPEFETRLTTTSTSDFWTKHKTDSDLAAHIVETCARGACLWGQSIEKTFPKVPIDDYLSSLLGDLRWARKRLTQPRGVVYAVLNACRLAVFVKNLRITSKTEGAEAALPFLPRAFRSTIATSLAAYRETATNQPPIDKKRALRLIDHVLKQTEQFRAEAAREQIGSAALRRTRLLL